MHSFEKYSCGFPFTAPTVHQFCVCFLRNRTFLISSSGMRSSSKKIDVFGCCNIKKELAYIDTDRTTYLFVPMQLQFRSMFASSPLYNSPHYEHTKRGMVFHLIYQALYVRFVRWMGEEGPVMPESYGAQSLNVFCRNSPSRNECNNS